MGAENEPMLHTGGTIAIDLGPDPVPPPILIEGPFRLISLGPEQLFLEALERAKQRAKKESKIKEKSGIPFEEVGDLLFPPKEKRVRIDSSGIIHIDFYKTKKMKPKGEKDRLERPYPDGIESAIRACFHIVDKNKPKGETTQNLLGILDLTRSLYEQFTNGQINEANLPQYVESAYKTLEDSHLLKPHSPNRQDAVKKILNALKKDSIGRFNPLKSRSQLGSADIRIIEEVLYTGFVEKKYSFIASLLLLERERERFYLEEVVRKSHEFLGRSFVSLDETEKAAIELRKQFNTYLYPDAIKTAPYRGPAVMSMIYTWGFPEDEVANTYWVKISSDLFTPELTNEYTNELQRENQYFDLSPSKMISLSRLKKRISNVISFIGRTLEEGEANLAKYYNEIQTPNPAAKSSVVV